MREPTVASVMTTKVITVGPETPFKEVVAALSGNGISAVPVVGPRGTVVGVDDEQPAYFLLSQPARGQRDGVVRPDRDNGGGHHLRGA